MFKYNQRVKIKGGLIGTIFARKSEIVDGLNTPTDFYYVDILEKDNKNFTEIFPDIKLKGTLVVVHKDEIDVI